MAGAKHSGMNQRPIFITARFRSGSTLLWNMFRNIPGCISYYEPCCESLLTHVEYNSPLDPNHLNVKDIYWLEYTQLLGLIRNKHKFEFGISNLYLEEQDDYREFEEYLKLLCGVAYPDIPVLQFNRVDFRLAWLRKVFPEAFILHMKRNPRDNWFSMVRLLPEGEWKNPFQDTLYSLTTWSLSLYGVFPFLFSPFVETTYHRHYLLWRLSALAGERQSDMSLDFDSDVLADPMGATRKLAALIGGDDLDLSKVAGLVVQPEHGRWRELASEQWFTDVETQCDSLLRSLGLLEHFGFRPIAEIEEEYRAEWNSFRRDSVQAMSKVASVSTVRFREDSFRLSNQLSKNVTNYENELTRLKGLVQTQQTEINEVVLMRQRKDEEVANLSAVLQGLSDSNSILHKHVADLGKLLSAEIEQRIIKEAEVSLHTTQLTSLREKCATMECRAAELVQALKLEHQLRSSAEVNLSRVSGVVDALQSEGDRLREQLVALTSELDSECSNRKASEAEAHLLAGVVDKLRGQIITLQTDSNELEDRLREQLLALTSEFESECSIRKACEAEAQLLAGVVDGLRGQIVSIQTESSELAERLDADGRLYQKQKEELLRIERHSAALKDRCVELELCLADEIGNIDVLAKAFAQTQTMLARCEHKLAYISKKQ